MELLSLAYSKWRARILQGKGLKKEVGGGHLKTYGFGEILQEQPNCQGYCKKI